MEQCEKYFILRVFLVSQCVYGFFMINLSQKNNSYTQNAGKRREMMFNIRLLTIRIINQIKTVYSYFSVL
mgnify:CR=1 FL=1